MTKEQAFLLCSMILTFFWLQISVFSIGNRPYSMRYKSQLLVEKKGVIKTIYFKPKHFHRYSLWEVLFFFASYIQLVVFLVIFAFSFKYNLARLGYVISGTLMATSFLAEFARVLYIDITRHIEDKKMASKGANLGKLGHVSIPNKKLLKAILSYSSTTRGQLNCLYSKRLSKISPNDMDEMNVLDKQFIQYYRDFQSIDVIDEKIMYLRDRYQRYRIEFSMDSKKRKDFPELAGCLYRPHFVLKGEEEYLGIMFESSSVSHFDVLGEAIVRTIYDPKMYERLLPDSVFTIREGNKIVGEGKVISKID